MRSLLVFAAIQIMIYIFSMSNATAIGIIILGMASVLFASTYLYAVVKDKRLRKKTIDAVLEAN